MINELKETKKIEVRFCEVDNLNVVWHGHYLKYFEDAREKFCKKYKLKFSDFIRKGYFTYISRYEVEHKLPLHYGEIAFVEIKLRDCKTCKLIFTYKIFNKQQQIVCLGKTEQVIVDKNKKLIIEWPDFMNKWRNNKLFI